MAWLNTTKSGVAVPYAKRIKLTLDGSKIEENLTDFPVLVKLSDESGILNTDVTNVFDELLYEVESIDDDFTGDDGDSLDSSLWSTYTVNAATVNINNNRARISIHSGSANRVDVPSIYRASGDFDVSVDWNLISAPSSNDWAFTRLSVYADDSKNLSLYYQRGSSWGFQAQSFDGSTYRSEANASVAYVSTKLRIKRVGSTWSVYYWNGSSWTTLVSSCVYINSIADVYFLFYAENYSPNYPAFVVEYDNFTVVADNIVYDPNLNKKKIAITSSDGETQQYVEIESWDAANKEAWLWTKCPTLASGVNSDLYLYYDKDAADNDTYVGETGSLAARNVWDDNFVGVWHMSQDPSGGTGCVKDSTSLSKDLTSGGSMTASDLVDGVIGKAIDFDGIDDCLTRGVDASFDVGSFTIESALNLINTGDLHTIFQYGDSVSTINYRLFSYFFQIGYSSGSWETVIMSSTPPYVTDVYLSVIKNGQNISFFMNDFYNGGGVLVNTGRTGTRSVCIGKSEQGSPDYYFLKGAQSELRFSNICRSSSWIKSTYYSNWDDLITYRIYHGYIEGFVYEKEVPVQRTLNLHARPYGVLMDSTISSVLNGYYYLETTYSGSHYIVCLDDEDGESYNDLISSRLYPTEIV